VWFLKNRTIRYCSQRDYPFVYIGIGIFFILA
jgi:hypothetical protein